MGTKVIIGSQVITLPASGADPNWSQGIIDSITALATQLQGIASTFDVPPSVQILTSNSNTNLSIINCVFPSDLVRSFNFTYAIYRTNGSVALAESGTVNAVYDTLISTWKLEHEFQGDRQSTGIAYNTFSMSGDQLVLSTVSIGGSYDSVNSKISYAARTILTSDS